MKNQSNPHPANSVHTYSNLKQACVECHLCKIREGVTQTVFGVGPMNPKYMFIGEAPGENEDIDGEPFTGKAGQMLMRLVLQMLNATRSEIFLANALKCRPPGNRDPVQEEFDNCNVWLQKQIYFLRPSVVVAVGKYGLMALRGVWAPDMHMGQERGRPGALKWNDLTIPYIACYHPAYALRNPAAIDSIKEDLTSARALIGNIPGPNDKDITMW